MKTFNKTLIFVGIVTLIRVGLASLLGLHPDEAYYWLWSRALDFCYYDHPPMFAYFIRLFTIFANSPFWVRLPALISGVIISFSVYKTARILFPYSERIPFWSVVILNVMPLVSSGIVMTPDVPALLFWSLSLWSLASLLVSSSSENEPKLPHHPSFFYTKKWLILGAISGLGMLSKYTSVLFPVCVLFYLLISPRNRRWLLTPFPYLAAITALVVFSPVIIWNARHQWISFAFQLKHGTGGSGINFANLLSYIGSQMAVSGVFPTIIGGLGATLFLFSLKESRRFLSSVTFPVLAFFGITSLKTTPEANWTAPAYVGISIITAAVIWDENGFNFIRKKILAPLTIGLPAALTLTLYLQSAFRVIHFEKINPVWVLMEPTNRFYGWEEFTDYISVISAGKPVIAPDHQSASLLLYYSRRKPIELRAGTNNFIFYEKYTSPVDGKCFTFDYTTDVKTGPVDFSKFSSVKECGVFRAIRDGIPIREYRIYECENFSGFTK